MMASWILPVVAGVLGLACLAYWQFVIAEGTYLGPRAVALMYDWVSRRYDGVKQFTSQDERWFVAGPLHVGLAGLTNPLILDVATGTGRVPLALLGNRFGGQRFGGQIIGLDLSGGMLIQARAKLRLYDDKVSLICQDASRLPFDDDFFDAVTCLESLEFFPRPLDALTEMVRVLAPEGVLFLSNRVGREARLLPGRAIPRARLASALTDLGLREVDVRPWQVSYDLATARKLGSRDTKERRRVSLAELLRCPHCLGRLRGVPTTLSCRACDTVYPVREGIVWLAPGRGHRG